MNTGQIVRMGKIAKLPRWGGRGVEANGKIAGGLKGQIFAQGDHLLLPRSYSPPLFTVYSLQCTVYSVQCIYIYISIACVVVA